MKRIIVALTIVLMVLTTGCLSTESSQVYEDKNIPNAEKEAAHKVANELLSSFKTKEKEVLKKHQYSNTIDQANIDAMYAQYEKDYADSKFELAAEYYTPSKSKNFVLLSVLKDYEMNLPTNNHEAYLLIYSDGAGKNQHTLTLVLLKDENKWKVLVCRIGSLKANGLKASELAKRAAKLFSEGNYVSAALYQDLALNTSELAPALIHKDREKFIEEMKTYQAKINELYKFPMKLTYEEKEVQLFSITTQVTKDGIVYIMNYVSSYPKIAGNEKNIELESQAIHEQVAKNLTGIENGTDSIVYKAFEELPKDSKKNYSTYGTVIEIDK